ncbi:MAG: c-type cytochrome [Geminicoccaceae bacterium]
MKRIAARLIVWATSLLVAGAGQAQDLANGERVATEMCVACHDVGADGAFKQYPPSFAAIAVYRSPEQILGRIIYPPQHGRMPQMGLVLDRDTIDDVVAYIMSLEQPR